MSDSLPVIVFQQLREVFFSDDLTPKPFSLPEKGSAQDDPLDRYIALMLDEIQGIDVITSGANTSPDVVVLDSSTKKDILLEGEEEFSSRIIGLEVKKLDRTPTGKVARLTGLDYNSTPPGPYFEVKDSKGNSVKIKSYTLFLCVEKRSDDYFTTAMVLSTNTFINSDDKEYVFATGNRTKEIGLGTFQDGVNRNRPMYVFGNPLSVDGTDEHATLILDSDEVVETLLHFQDLRRQDEAGRWVEFRSYQDSRDLPASHVVQTINDPVKVPSKRTSSTNPRGKFELDFEVTD